MAFGFGGILGGGAVPDVQMPDGLPVSGGQGSPLVDAFLALQAKRLQDAVTAPRDAYSGDLQVFGPDGHPTDEAMGRAAGMAGLAMTGSMPFKAPAGAIRSFGGGESFDDLLASMSSALDKGAASVTSDVRPISRIDPKAASWDLFHGTDAPADFARFDTNLPKSSRGHTPSSETGAVFLSPAADEAAQYSGSIGGRAGAEAGPRVIRTTVDPGKTDVFDLPYLMEHDPSFIARARQTVIDDAGGMARAGPMFDERHARMLDEFQSTRDLNKQLADLGYPATEVPQVQWGYGATGAAMQMARERGLDTAVLRGLSESNGGDQVVALTPGRVRSYYDPDHVLYSGGPAGALAGLPALASSSDPKGQPVSAGPAPSVPSMLDGLSPDMIARLMQAAQAQQDQAAPAVGSPEVPDARVSPYQPATPPTGAPTPVNLAGYGAPAQPAPQPPVDAPLASVLGAPSMNAGQMPATAMPVPPPAAPLVPPAPSMVGAPPPVMMDPGPGPQTTGALPKPPAPSPQGEEDAPATPAPRAVPLPPTRPPEMSAPAGPLAPVNSFDPLTGQPVSGTPRPMGLGGPAPVAAPSAGGKPEGPGLMQAWKQLADTGIGDQLLAFGSGLLSGGGAAGWAQAGQNMLKASSTASANQLAQSKAQMEQYKFQREQAAQNQTAKIIAQRMGIPLEDATALAVNPQFVQGFLTSQFGAQDGRVRNADGTMSVVQGSAQDPGQIKAAADASRETIPEAAARAGAITKATTENSGDTIETQQVPGVGFVAINKDKILSEDPAKQAAAMRVVSPGQAPRPMTPQESKDFQGGYFDANGVPHTQAGGVTVNMPPAEKAEQAKIGEARGNVVADQITAGKSAVDRIRTLDQMSGALVAAGPNITTGPLGEPVLRAKQALGGLLGRELPGTSATEMFNNMGPILAGEAARAITNRPAQIEFTTMLNSKPGLMNSVEGNRAMMDVMRQRAVQDSELANIAARSNSTDEYLKKKDEYEASHPMINPFTGQPFGSASTPEASAGGEASSGRIVQVRTAAERDGLATGARYIAPDGKLRIKQ